MTYMSKRTDTILRMLIAVVFGIAMSAITLQAARTSVVESPLVDSRANTFHRLHQITDAIEEYRKIHHRLPASLDEPKRENVSLQWWDKPGIPDMWFRPFHYSVSGTHYIVVSYGRDGKPGGSGLDRDISSTNPKDYETWKTFWEFVTSPDTREVTTTALACGVVAAALCLFVIRSVHFERTDMLKMVGYLVGLFVATLYITAIITSLHIPSGH
jgi:Type II secretion system (T2SS), protein G